MYLMQTATKTADIKVRLTQEHREELSRLAAADDRTLSDYVRRILADHVAEAAA